eukprot:3149339-Pyramimonas_sp.AAC.2
MPLLVRLQPLRRMQLLQFLLVLLRESRIILWLCNLYMCHCDYEDPTTTPAKDTGGGNATDAATATNFTTARTTITDGTTGHG